MCQLGGVRQLSRVHLNMYPPIDPTSVAHADEKSRNCMHC